VLEIIKKHGGELLVKETLFDEFKKGDKISYAFRLVFQSFERTLGDAEINKIMENLTKVLNEKSGWAVR
jgi:phenylalanyl-tRNA synthetase beta subunit